MKKRPLQLVTAAFVAALGALSAACTSPCDTLKTTCARCTAPEQLVDKTYCNGDVAGGNGDLCKAAQASYDTLCP